MSFFLNSWLFNKSARIVETTSYSLDFPDHWKTKRNLFADATIAEFFNLNEVAGIIQVSSYSHADPAYVVNLEEELIKNKEYDKAQIYKIGDNQAVVYLENTGQAVRYSFVFGKGNRKLYITFTTNNNFPQEKIDKDWNAVIGILSTLKIK